MTHLLIITAAGVLTWVLRASFITLGGNRELPEQVQQVLRHARPALLAALLVSATLGTGGLGAGLALAPRIAGVAVAGAAAWRWRNLTVTLLVGFAAYWAIRTALALAA